MRLFLICDNEDTATGMRLAGIESIITNDKSDVVNKLNEISSMAENLYRQAYIVKNSDSTQCKALLNQAIRMVSSTDPVYAKAREMLSTLP